jgi:hypothetical protein
MSGEKVPVDRRAIVAGRLASAMRRGGIAGWLPRLLRGAALGLLLQGLWSIYC